MHHHSVHGVNIVNPPVSDKSLVRAGKVPKMLIMCRNKSESWLYLAIFVHRQDRLLIPAVHALGVR